MTRASPCLRRLRPPNQLRGRFYATQATPITSADPVNARLRFAPSPTGYLHLGGLRTALFNHLLARKWKGKWILRIEDTDRARLVPGAIDSLRNTLEWAGLDYNEGVGVGGSRGPYIQSERLDLYHQYANQLLDQDLAYECFCSPAETQSIKSDLQKQGLRHTYDGRCRHLTDEDRARRKRAGQKFVVRFKPDRSEHERTPLDLVYGDVQFPPEVDDFVLLKSDGWPTYHLASVVDDHEMEISHVLRGEEWLPSVTKHYSLYRALGWTPPQFAHLPLLVNADGSKLSKRTGDVHVESYRNIGYEPEALLNFLALMGWDHHSALDALSQTPTDTPSSTSLPGNNAESRPSLPALTRSDTHSYYDLFTIPQLTAAFSLDHVNHKKAAVNLSKLDFINKMTLRRKAGRLGDDGVLVEMGKEGLDDNQHIPSSPADRKEMISRVQGYFREQKVLKDNPLVEDLAYVEKVFDSELARTVLLKDMGSSSIFFFLEPDHGNKEATDMLRIINPLVYVDLVEMVVKKLANLPAPGDRITQDEAWGCINAVISAKGVEAKKDLLSPMRHALTARKKGPSVPAIIEVLGKRRSLGRLEDGLAYIRRSIRAATARR